MEILSIIVVSVISVITLFLLTKLMGNKQVSQLSMFDYITGISIGSVAAEFATELENPEHSLTAICDLDNVDTACRCERGRREWNGCRVCNIKYLVP